jgi:hypothetical protein
MLKYKFNENINVNKAKLILKNRDILTTIIKSDNGFDLLEKCLHMKYVKYREKHKNQRYYPVNISVGMLNKKIRDTILEDCYIDIDLSNSVCNVMYYLCKKNNIECPHLIHYILNRNKLKLNNFDLSKLKKHIYCLIFGSENKINNKYIVNLDIEIKYIINILGKIYGKTINVLYQETERLIMDYFCNYIINIFGIDYFKKCIYLNDGMLIPKINTKIDNIISNLNSSLNRKFNSNNIFEFKIKPFTNVLDLSKLKKLKFINKPVSDLMFIDFSIFKNAHLSEAEDEIIIWFNECCKYLISGGNRIVFTKNKDKMECVKISAFYNTLNECMLINSKRTSLSSVIKKLLKNDKVKIYDKPQFYPHLKKDTIDLKGNLNLFTYFDNDNDNECKDDIFINSDFYLHIKDIICYNNDKLFNYILNFIAHLIQKPYENPEVGLIFYSYLHGIGKNMFAEIFISKLIGRKYLTLLKNGNGFFNKFNSTQMNKLVVVFDELKANGSEFVKNYNFLKGIITSSKLHIELKGFEAFEIDNFARYIFLSNNKHIIYIEPHDRRFVSFECNSEYFEDMPKTEKREYFNNMFKLLNNDKFIKSSFNYFCNRDITNWHPRMIVHSKLKSEMNSFNMKNIYSFMLDFIQEYDKDIYTDDNLYFRFMAKSLYDYYKMWCDEHNERKNKYKTVIENLKYISVEKVKWNKRDILRNKWVFFGKLSEIEKKYKILLMDDDFKLKAKVKFEIEL